MQKIKEAIIDLIKHLPGGRLLVGYYFLCKNHLSKSGWKKSIVTQLSVARDGSPLPWFTYGCIHFLEPRLLSSFSVFEFGSGNSTRWFSAKVGKVSAIEHDWVWYEFMNKKLSQSSNASCMHRDLDSTAYEEEILNHSREFDIIVLDGRKRVACSKNALGALKEDGVIIWDNSDREQYTEGYDFLTSKGFKRLDFWGMGPISAHLWCTSVFYKDKNCLGI